MLIAEYDYDVDIAVQREEEREIALKEGEAKGFSLGIAQGKQEGISAGSHQKALETAQILKQLGDPIQKIAQATGLTEKEINQL